LSAFELLKLKKTYGFRPNHISMLVYHQYQRLSEAALHIRRETAFIDCYLLGLYRPRLQWKILAFLADRTNGGACLC